MLQIQILVIQFTKSLQPQLAGPPRPGPRPAMAGWAGRRGVEARDAKFADQLRRSLLAIGLNLGEGYRASGGAKRRAYRIALGEASELEMGLAMAGALGYCTLSTKQEEALQRILAVLQKLARPRY